MFPFNQSHLKPVLITLWSLRVLLVVLMTMASYTQAQSWSHLELGAGNYGAEGLPQDEHFGGGLEQYKVLYETLDQLVTSKGGHGVLLINDLHEDVAAYAAKALQQYAEKKGYTQVQIKVVPGDFSTIPLPQVDSVHLKNPDLNLLRKPFFAKAIPHLLSSTRQNLLVQTHFENLFELVARLTQTTYRKLPEKGPPYYFPDGQVTRDSKTQAPVPTTQYLIQHPHLSDNDGCLNP